MELNILLLVEAVLHKFLNSNGGNNFFMEKREYRCNRRSNYSSTKERYKKTGSEEATFIPSTPIRVRSSSGNFHLSRDSVGTILGSQGQYAKATQRSELIAISSIHFLNSLC